MGGCESQYNVNLPNWFTQKQHDLNMKVIMRIIADRIGE
jgi:hypothetical protein